MSISITELDNGIAIDPVVKPRLQPAFAARNGMLVSAKLQADMAALVNQVAYRRTKQHFRSSGDVTDPTEKTYRFAGHIGPMAGTMVARVLMAPTEMSSSTKNPKIQLALYDTSGNALTSGTAHFGSSYGRTPDISGEEWGVATIALDVSNLQDTAFRAQLHSVDEAKVICCTVYEVAVAPDERNGFARQTYAVGESILEEDRSSIQDLAVALYKRGGPSLFNFSSENELDDVMVFTDATYAVYGAGGDLFSYRIDQSFCNRKSATTVPVKIECYAGMLSPGTGYIQVVDNDGNAYATFTIFNPVGVAEGWLTAVLTDLPADERTYRIQGKTDGASTLVVYAVSCFRFAD